MVLFGSEEFYLQELNNKRVKCGLISKMINEGANINMNSIHDGSQVFLQKVKDFIACYPRFDNSIKQAALKDQLKYLCGLVRNDLIPIDSFKWLKDDRACYFAWLTIQTLTGTYYNDTTNIYSYMPLSKSCLSTNERFDSVISFFDLWGVNNNEKLTCLEGIKKAYQDSLECHPFKGLNKKDTEQIQWHYQYIKRFLAKKYSKYSLSNIYDSNQLAFYINPTTDEEVYHLIYALYDTWSPMHNDKEKFKSDLSKANSQCKFREKNKDKKPLNTYLTKETKAKLEKLSAHYNNKTLHDTLDVIIRQAYEQTIKNRLLS